MRGSHHCVDGAQRAPTVCVVYMAAPAGHRTTSATARPPHIHALRTPHGLARFTMREGGRACSSLTRPRARLLEGWRQESIAPGSTPPPARSIVPAPSTVASMHLAPLPLHEREGRAARARLLPPAAPPVPPPSKSPHARNGCSAAAAAAPLPPPTARRRSRRSRRCKRRLERRSVARGPAASRAERSCVHRTIDMQIVYLMRETVTFSVTTQRQTEPEGRGSV